MTSRLSTFFNQFKNRSKEKIPRDPVCGMKATTGITSQYQGLIYYFCSAHCKNQFDQDPAAYI